jgi:V8-like Glu-specific endopeptidase
MEKGFFVLNQKKNRKRFLKFCSYSMNLPALFKVFLYTSSMWLLIFFLFSPPSFASLGESECLSNLDRFPHFNFLSSLEAKLLKEGLIEGDPRGKLTKEATVYGEDDRKTVNISIYPYRTIGKMVHEKGSCSSALISPCHVLTARHCATSKSGEYQMKFGVGTFVSAKKVLEGKSKSYENDWAILKLEKSVGNELGWMPILTRTPDQLKDGKCKLGGYPSDINQGFDLMVDETATFKGDFSDWKHGAPPKEIKSFGKNMVQIKADAYLGNSGGPIFCMDKDGVANLVAVMSFVMGAPGGNAYLPEDSDFFSGAVASSSFAKQVKKMRQSDTCPEENELQ